MSFANSPGCNCCGGGGGGGGSYVNVCSCPTVPTVLSLAVTPPATTGSPTDVNSCAYYAHYYAQFQATTLTYYPTAASLPSPDYNPSDIPGWYSPFLSDAYNGSYYYVFRCNGGTYQLLISYASFGGGYNSGSLTYAWSRANSANTCSPFGLCVGDAGGILNNGLIKFYGCGGRLMINCAGGVAGATGQPAMMAEPAGSPPAAAAAEPALVPLANSIRLTRAAKSCPHRTAPSCGCPDVPGRCALGKGRDGAVTMLDCISCQAAGGPDAGS